MDKQNLVRVFVKGGVLTPADFLNILLSAKDLGAEFLHFGSRQDILFPAKGKSRATLDEVFRSTHTDYEVDDFTHQNIVSSYAALDVVPNMNWLNAGVYHRVLASFDFKAKCRINLVDPTQSLVPLFTGNINFVASAREGFWHLYLRAKQWGSVPVVHTKIYRSEDLALVAKHINDLDLEGQGITKEAVWEKVDSLPISTEYAEGELAFSQVPFPYYEGLNRESGGNYWLGLYWRNNKFTLNFLISLCKRCMATEVKTISLTPWKSFIVKGIEERFLVGWEKLMGKFGINLRHSSLELNWHLPVLSEESLALKEYLVRALDKQDMSTSGLTFTIKPNDDIYLFTSVVVEINPAEGGRAKTYNILYARDFAANAGVYHTYVNGVTRNVIPAILIELSVMYFDQLADVSLT